MSKVTIRGVIPVLWTKARVECAQNKELTLGDIVNQGLAKRYGIKLDEKGKIIKPAR